MSCKMQIGLELAAILAGSWRLPPSRNATLSNENLHRYAVPLAETGGAALTWFRIRRHTSELSESVLNVYRAAYLGSTARAAAHEAELERVAQTFHSAGIRSILLKGWSVGRLYPESGLRPSGDIDLWVDPEQRRVADTILRDLAVTQAVDLDHDQMHRFEEPSFGKFYDSCETAR